MSRARHLGDGLRQLGLARARRPFDEHRLVESVGQEHHARDAVVGQVVPKPPPIRRSSATGTRSPSTRSSSTLERPTRKRSCGSRSSRLPSTTPLSVSPGATSSTTGTLVGPAGRHPGRRRSRRARRPARVLPGVAGRLDTALAASLAEIPDGPRRSRASAMASARQTGSSSCARTTAVSPRSPSMTRLRPGSGGRPRPRLRRSSIRGWPSCGRCCSIRPASSGRVPPPALTSQTYTEDFNEVKAVGSATSTVRTPEQTDDRTVHRREHLPARQLVAA